MIYFHSGSASSGDVRMWLEYPFGGVIAGPPRDIFCISNLDSSQRNFHYSDQIPILILPPIRRSYYPISDSPPFLYPRKNIPDCIIYYLEVAIKMTRLILSTSYGKSLPFPFAEPENLTGTRS